MLFARCSYVSKREPAGCPNEGIYWTGRFLLCEAHAMVHQGAMEIWDRAAALLWATANAPWLIKPESTQEGEPQ